MLPLSIKARVRDAFDRAAPTYDGAAVVQRRVCDRLLDKLAIDQAPRHIVDAGCGTGYGARRLRERWPEADLTGVDFAPAMLDFARHNTDHCLTADIEHLPFENARFDLWWSSLTIQWCDTEAVFREAARILKPGGHLAVSTLGPGTFAELRNAFAHVDQHRHTLPFSDPEPITTAPPVWRTTSTVSTVLVPGSFSAASTLAFNGTFLPPRRPSSAVMISLLAQSPTRSAMELAAKPPNTTEWIAPIRAQASIATAASTIIGR